MPPASNEAQIIARELSNTLRKMAQDQQSFLNTLSDRLTQDAQSQPGSRRSSPGNSPSGAMEANRRLIGSVKNLAKNIESATPIVSDFASELVQATKKLKELSDVNTGGNPSTTGGSGNTLRNHTRYNTSLFRLNRATVIATKTINNFTDELRRVLQGGTPPPPNNTNNNNNPNPNPNNNNTNNNNPNPDPNTNGPQGAFGKFILSKLSQFSFFEAGKNALSDVKTAMSTSSQYGPSTYTDSLTLGMTPQEYLKLGADYRTEMLKSSNGMVDWTKSLHDAKMDLFPFTSSLADAAKVTADLQKTLTNSGISFENVAKVVGTGRGGLIGSLKNLSMITGQTVIQLVATLGTLLSNDDARQNMMRIDSKDRGKYVQDQAQMLLYYTKLTGSLSRAQEIMAKQQQTQSQTFKDRWVQTAKRAALGRTMGAFKNDKEMNDYSSLSRMNPSRRSKEQHERMQRYNDNLNRAYQSFKGSANPYQENIADKFDEVAGLKELSVNNTSLDTPLKDQAISNQNINAVSAKLANSNDPLIAATSNLLATTDMLGTITKNALTITGLALAGVLAKGAFNRYSRNNTNSPIDPNNPPPTNSPNGGRMKLGLGVAGIATAAAGYALDKFYTPESELGETGKNVASSVLEFGGTGAMIGAFAGPLGAAIGAALGGTIGAVYGLTQDTKPQSMYEAEESSRMQSTIMMVAKVNHEKQMKNFEAQMAKQQQIIDAKGTADVAAIAAAKQQLSLIEQQQAKAVDGYAKQSDALSKVQQASMAYMESLKGGKNLAKAADSAFGEHLGGMGSAYFDPTKFAEVGKFANGNLGFAEDFAKTMSTTLPVDELIRISEKITNGEKLYDADIATMKSYNDIKMKEANADMQNKRNNVKDVTHDAKLATMGTDTYKALSSMSELKDVTVQGLRKQVVAPHYGSMTMGMGIGGLPASQSAGKIFVPPAKNVVPGTISPTQQRLIVPNKEAPSGQTDQQKEAEANEQLKTAGILEDIHNTAAIGNKDMLTQQKETNKILLMMAQLLGTTGSGTTNPYTTDKNYNAKPPYAL